MAVCPRIKGAVVLVNTPRRALARPHGPLSEPIEAASPTFVVADDASRLGVAWASCWDEPQQR